MSVIATPTFVANAIETLCRRVPPDIHPMSKAYIQEDLCAMHDAARQARPDKVTRLIANVRARIVREWRWEAEMHANDFHDYREAYKLRRRAERFEASALTANIDHRRRAREAKKTTGWDFRSEIPKVTRRRSRRCHRPTVSLRSRSSTPVTWPAITWESTNMRADMDLVLALWLRDHPGGTVEDYERAGRPFNAERGSRHRRAHNAFLNWLNTPRIQQAIWRDEKQL